MNNTILMFNKKKGEVDTPVQINAESILFTQSHFNEIINRSTNGPFRVVNDFENTQNPPDLSRVETDANYFLNTDFSTASFNSNFFSRINGMIVWNGVEDTAGNNNSGYYTAGTDACSAAYWYKITNNQAYGDKVKQYLLAQRSLNIFSSGYEPYPGDTKQFHTGNFVARWCQAYDLTKELFSASEKDSMLQWLRDCGNWFAIGMHDDLKVNFPDRLNRNWSNRSNVAASEAKLNDFAYFEIQSGTARNQLTWLSQWYNNRRFSQIQVPAFVSAVLNGTVYQSDSDTLKEYVKLFVMENLQFGTYADGSHGEFARNGNYATAQSGYVYYGINIMIQDLCAHLFAMQGDFELLNYVTSNGLGGTQGGNKSLKFANRIFCELANQDLDWCSGGSSLTQREENRIDITSATGRQWTIDTWAAIGNLHYKDSYVQNVYLRRASNMPNYPNGNNEGSSGPVNSPYWNRAGTYNNLLAVLGFWGGIEFTNANSF